MERRRPTGAVLVVVRLAVSAVSGVALALAFPPYDLTWLAVPAVAGLTLAVRGTRPWFAAVLGLVTGVLFFGSLVQWLSVVGTDAWLLLTAYCSLWIALVGAGTALLQRLRGWPLWVATLWVLQEALRDRVPMGGFPWGRLAYAQTETALTPYAALAGAPLVTFATALAGALLAYALLRLTVPDGAGPSRWLRPSAALAGILLLLVASRLVPLPTSGETADGPSSAVVAVVQGDVPQTGLDAFGQRRAVLDNHVRETLLLAERVAAGEVPQPEAVIWPENASDLDPYAVPEARAAIDAAVRAIGVPVLVGAVVTNPDDPATVLNVGIVWDPVTGPGERYAKRHPVPFGEFVPFRSVLSRFIDRFDRVPRDFAPGNGPGVLDVGPVRVGDVICFEVAYDTEVRDAVTAGGRVLVVQTNNATYGRTGQPEQQLAMSRLRAVEHGRAVLVAATSGISAVIAPDGTVVASLPEFVGGSIVREVPLRDTLTLADRVGAVPEGVASLVAVVALVLAWRRRDVGSGGDGDAVAVAVAEAPPGRDAPVTEDPEARTR
ncbi:MAG: apolipoprotein N-acyltransferase [Candidatus Nanopelagicales bacterium]